MPPSATASEEMLNTWLGAAIAAAATAPVFTKSRLERKVLFEDREAQALRSSGQTGVPVLQECSLDMEFPPLFVLAGPHFHCVGVFQDVAVLWIEMEFAIGDPGDVGELKHGHGHVAHGDWRVEFFAFLDAGDEIREVCVGHRITAD